MKTERSEVSAVPQGTIKTSNGAKIGYARVSTKDQNLDLQIDALQK